MRTPKRKPAGQYQHGDLRRALVDAAVQILAEEGSDAFTLREAARRVGVDHRAAYRHFEDKDALLAAVALEGYTRFTVRAEKELAGVRGARARLLAIARVYVESAYREPARYRVMTGPRLNEAGRFPELETAIDGVLRLLARELRSRELARARLRRAHRDMGRRGPLSRARAPGALRATRPR